VLARPKVEVAVRLVLHLAAAVENPWMLNMLAPATIPEQEIEISPAEIP
jgi:hypothetical protein